MSWNAAACPRSYTRGPKAAVNRGNLAKYVSCVQVSERDWPTLHRSDADTSRAIRNEEHFARLIEVIDDLFTWLVTLPGAERLNALDQLW